MKQKNHQGFDQNTIDMNIDGQLIAEIPNSSELFKFDCTEKELPVLSLADLVAYPGIPHPVKLDEEADLKLCQDVFIKNGFLIAAVQKDDVDNASKLSDLYPIATICRLAKVINIPMMPSMAILIPGPRITLKKIIKRGSRLKANYEILPDISSNTDAIEETVISNEIMSTFTRIMEFVPEQEREHHIASVSAFGNDAVKLVSHLANHLPFSIEEKVSLLSSSSTAALFESFLRMLNFIEQKLNIQAAIHQRTHESLTEEQKKHFLHQQIKNIHEELGENEDPDEEELRQKALKKEWSDEARKHFDKEFKKLSRFNPQSPDYAIQYSYIETLVSLPWGHCDDSMIDIDKVEEVLNRDHYGLDAVKERIIEQMSVIKLRKDLKAPILCLYGPPGVGKTSLGKSIADALGRKYARISLGGLHDEAEIRGHRRTYIGAMPGRIISALSKCGTGNPVFVLDEIDKIGKDFKGDPSTALLEVLDPEQNSKFHDNYVDFDYDLSKVLFIATANSLSEISRPLLDRMEIIEIGGYILEEKIEIARRHLVPKSLIETGFGKDEIKFTKDALRLIVERYTRESGVRQLEKKISKVLRKIARLKASGKEFPKKIDAKTARELLGKEEVNPDSYENNKFAGVVTGLAWTQVGGEILFIETSLSPGNGEKLTLTGNLGDVMKESAAIALQYIKAHSKKLGIDPEIFGKYNVHIHVPEGAIPKDGPSAGITMATSLVSAFTGRKVRDKLAMTGEITLRGKVLPVGGIKEKILAAKRAGISQIILSQENRRDIEEINERYLKGLVFHYLDTIEDVLKHALLPDLAEFTFLP